MGFALLLFLLEAATEQPAERPIVGAIRWDGWFQDNPWEKNLAPKEWRYRLPFYGKIAEDGSCHVCSDSQETMDREIAYAKAGGIAYWAFCYYHPKSWPQADAYNYGWRRYLKSERKKDVNFCLLLQGGSHMGPAAEWTATVAEFIGLFKEPTYQRVCGNRPLIYVFACEHLIPHFGSPEAAGKAFALLREESRKAGTGDPYIVAQIWTHQIKADFLGAIRFDALGAYSAQGGKGGKQTYADLIESNRSYWEQYRASGYEVAPTVNAGWDGRPRKYDGPWYEQGTPLEIAAAIKSAFDWIQANRDVSPARTVLVYAWNEHDEGGWLCPTIEEGAARLETIRAMLDAYKP